MHFPVMYKDYVMQFKSHTKINLAEYMDKITVITRCDNALSFCVMMSLQLAHIGTGNAVLTETYADLRCEHRKCYRLHHTA